MRAGEVAEGAGDLQHPLQHRRTPLQVQAYARGVRAPAGHQQGRQSAGVDVGHARAVHVQMTQPARPGEDFGDGVQEAVGVLVVEVAVQLDARGAGRFRAGEA
ncbi:hypothetical protein Sxan_77690 [Streptomyces xanthophaeus]|uniref:Uncharacterized protein n=1 Tax=Streptomyces xanthophaeus TaxID=67385 RepID=A0A919H651_9ACTN|nr:hypothetical protein Sxan_77690 [Streptomyces xanthophaeus]